MDAHERVTILKKKDYKEEPSNFQHNEGYFSQALSHDPVQHMNGAKDINIFHPVRISSG